VGSYQILEEIAAGGMGIVFKARQESPMFTRETALKFMLAGPEARQETRDRFVDEVKALASLSHPGLVSIYDSGIEGDLYYFSMELIDGWSLDDAEKARALPFARKVELVRDVARALAYLHEKGVIHRDVKPGNIMVDRHGRARLLDFGIAQFSTDARRRAAQAGTPYFMAPEVVAPTGGFGPIGAATDVYALGAVLYQILFSRPVFESDRRPGSRARPHSPRAALVPQGAWITDSAGPSGHHRALPPEARGRALLDGANVAGALDDFLRRSRFRLPAWAAAGVLLAGAVLLTLSAREGTEKAQVRARKPTFDRGGIASRRSARSTRPPRARWRISSLPLPARSEAGKDVSPEAAAAVVGAERVLAGSRQRRS
jgi:serine/threonine protein kinase